MATDNFHESIDSPDELISVYSLKTCTEAVKGLSDHIKATEEIIEYPEYWGEDSPEWRPSRFIKPSPSSSLDDEESITPAQGTFLAWRETPERGRKRVLDQIEKNSTPVLLLQMLHPKGSPLI
ncbi:cytochrome P450 [Diaporthe eres]|nr:cytochrome P450 [Diaporthe eres]